jgi:hypothetical protein
VKQVDSYQPVLNAPVTLIYLVEELGVSDANVALRGT